MATVRQGQHQETEEKAVAGFRAGKRPGPTASGKFQLQAVKDPLVLGAAHRNHG